ncbi:MAG: DUF4157 domain-containing protein [Ekhidna sp.]
MNLRTNKTQASKTQSVAGHVAQRKANNTGLPDNLKSGIEGLSGHSMDDVKVHYNSSRPAQLQAHAFAQGNQIHLASGQEKHLPHEAWHVVQQKQGRVKPTMQLKSSVPVNDDPGLEHEADVMGAKASNHVLQKAASNKLILRSPFSDLAQLVRRNRKRWTSAQREQSRKFWDKKEAKEKRMADSAFMRNEVIKPDKEQGNKEELPLDIKGNFPLEDKIDKVILQGSTKTGEHQDVICTLSSGKNLRFSRNQAADTAQFGADLGRMATIKVFAPSSKKTVKDALKAFRQAHDAIPCYFHGDCQSFADKIVHNLTGSSTGFGHDSDDDLFSM